VKASYLASPPLVVAYALAGSMNVDLYKEPLGKDKDGKELEMVGLNALAKLAVEQLKKEKVNDEER